jgi:hypothetical protein
MRSLSILIILLVSFNSICQTSANNEKNNIIGIWQSGTNEISSGYLDTYKFYGNNKFEFKPTGYNGLNRIIKIAGTYKIDDGKITFYINSITELIGDKIERSTTSTQSDSWAIENGKLITRKIKSKEQTAIFEFCKLDEKSICFQIDNRMFYKLEVE